MTIFRSLYYSTLQVNEIQYYRYLNIFQSPDPGLGTATASLLITVSINGQHLYLTISINGCQILGGHIQIFTHGSELTENFGSVGC
jgi:hypothetical protein